jgi:hypothetical protein
VTDDEDGLVIEVLHENVKPQKIHFIGGTVIVKGKSVTRRGAGWPVCCDGDRATAIKRNGSYSYDRAKVTCKSCLKQIDRHDFSARMHPDVKQWPELA